MAVGACAKPRRRGFARSCGRVCASIAPSASTASSGWASACGRVSCGCGRRGEGLELLPPDPRWPPRCSDGPSQPPVFVPRVWRTCPVGVWRRSDVVDTPLRQKTCRRCSRLFAICASCDRGHAYCSSVCRTAARRRSVRAARRRHRASPEGRLDHRDHQRAYRARV